MKSVEFCYWLQGMFELGDTSGGISSEKTEVIKRHLSMVFHHEIDPSYGAQQAQQVLNALHGKEKVQIGGQSADGTLFRC